MHNSTEIILQNTKLQQEDKIKYFEFVIEEANGNIECRIRNRITSTSWVCYALSKTFLNKREMSRDTKVKIYKTVYLPTLLNGKSIRFYKINNGI